MEQDSLIQALDDAEVEIKQLTKQRDDLLAALEKIVDSDGTPWIDLIKEARDAIAAAKGGA